MDEDGDIVYSNDEGHKHGQRHVEISVLADELIELSNLRKVNKELTEENAALKEENMQLKSQLQARDEWLRHAGAKMLSFGTDGRAGFWQKNLQKYLTQVSDVL